MDWEVITMKLAYADPPYIGQAKRHYKNDPSGIPAQEVDYPALIEKLLTEYDGFALSLSAPSLRIIDLLIHGPDPKHPKNLDVRTAAWVKPHCSWKPWNNVAYTWEPVKFRTVRIKGERPTPRDHIVANSTRQRGTHGAKPDEFCAWILGLIGYKPERDTIEDMYPGSGAFTRAVERRILKT